MGKEKILESLKSRIHQDFSLDKLLCYFTIPVIKHVSKKNGRKIFVNRATGRLFPSKGKDLRSAENSLQIAFKSQMQAFNITYPIDERIWAIYFFHFETDSFFTKKGQISRKLPDLSNLLELPSDCLTQSGVISDDTLIDSFDLSRRLVGAQTKLEVFLLRIND